MDKDYNPDPRNRASGARDITDEVEQETGSAGPSYTNQDEQPEPNMPAPFKPTEQDRRRDALYQALSSFGQHGVPNTKIAIQRAESFLKYIDTGEGLETGGQA